MPLLFRFRAYGTRNVPRSGPVILASNHQSFLDPAFAAAALPRQVHFMARDTLFRNRWFGWFIRRVNAFDVKRQSGDIRAMRETLRRLKGGELVLLFAEGTRTTTGKIGSLKPGLGLLAYLSKALVVPVTIDGAYECWPRSRKLPRSGDVRIMFGRPMYVRSKEDGVLQDFMTDLGRTLVEQQRQLRQRSGRGGLSEGNR